MKKGPTTASSGEISPRARAAQYVCMSTEHQNYSIDNQRDAIRDFADGLGYEIVATYEDSGRSGLNLEGRAGLQRLLTDIEGGNADFEVVLDTTSAVGDDFKTLMKALPTNSDATSPEFVSNTAQSNLPTTAASAQMCSRR